jgi:hypothetical protein
MPVATQSVLNQDSARETERVRMLACETAASSAWTRDKIEAVFDATTSLADLILARANRLRVSRNHFFDANGNEQCRLQLCRALCPPLKGRGPFYFLATLRYATL